MGKHNTQTGKNIMISEREKTRVNYNNFYDQDSKLQ